MDCTFADDAYLVAAFPGVAQSVPERWAVTVVAAQQGPYTLTAQGAAYGFDAGLGATVTEVRDGLRTALGAQMFAAVVSSGANAIVLQEASQGPLDLAVIGPADGTITATLINGGDGNAAGRAFWLEKVKCWLPPCCLVTCKADYPLMHAALAAHYIDKFAGGATGGSASMGQFKSMRLGPASLEAAAKAWASANPADSALDDGGPGSLYLSIRARYIFGVRCG